MAEMSEKQTVREEIILEQAQEIERLKLELRQQKAWTDTQRNVINAYSNLLRRIMSVLAIQSVIQNTHRERNIENGQLIRDINNELTRPIDRYFTDEYREIDDIPF